MITLTPIAVIIGMGCVYLVHRTASSLVFLLQESVLILRAASFWQVLLAMKDRCDLGDDDHGRKRRQTHRLLFVKLVLFVSAWLSSVLDS